MRAVPARWAAAAHPFIYEINTWPWLTEQGARWGHPVDLGSVPNQVWDEVAGLGCDAVWLMGVWRRSPAGIEIAMRNPGLTDSFTAALPDWAPADVVGSPYCVRDYVVDEHLGGPAGLASAREALASRGVALLLDFVPNHVAPDHPWTRDRPDLCISGTDGDLRRDPGSFVRAGDRVLANGRDPYFPAWPDVVQLNAFATSLRAAVIDTLDGIAEQCDGVRCDMAMLLRNEVFARTWGERAGRAPVREYWPTVIAAVRTRHPDFCFIAEAYWDMEWDLQQDGFDFCYDKRLYDRIRGGSADEVRGHLSADPDYQRRLVRFTENHDEPCAATVFGGRHAVAAVAALTQTGARLVHHGQLTGRRVQLPVFLGRYPDEPVDVEIASFYRGFLATVRDRTFHEGSWSPAGVSGWPGDDRWHNLVAWCWEGEHRWLVVVNLADGVSAGQVAVPWQDLRGRRFRLTDPTHDVTFDRSGDDLSEGLYVQLDGGSWHLLRVEELTESVNSS